LTSFLRDQGIESRPRQRDERRVTADPVPAPSNGFASPTRLHEIDEGIPPPTPPAVEEPLLPEASTSSGKKRKLPVESSGKKGKGKRKKGDEGAEDWELDFTAAKKGRYDDRPPGKIAQCAECNKRAFVLCSGIARAHRGAGFTVTQCASPRCVQGCRERSSRRYTKSLPTGAGQLCLPCEKELGDLGDAAPAPKKKARAVKPKPQPVEKLKADMPTLQENCIRVRPRAPI
jgi:DNA repair protein RAD7